MGKTQHKKRALICPLCHRRTEVVGKVRRKEVNETGRKIALFGLLSGFPFVIIAALTMSFLDINFTGNLYLLQIIASFALPYAICKPISIFLFSGYSFTCSHCKQDVFTLNRLKKRNLHPQNDISEEEYEEKRKERVDKSRELSKNKKNFLNINKPKHLKIKFFICPICEETVETSGKRRNKKLSKIGVTIETVGVFLGIPCMALLIIGIYTGHIRLYNWRAIGYFSCFSMVSPWLICRGIATSFFSGYSFTCEHCNNETFTKKKPRKRNR